MENLHWQLSVLSKAIHHKNLSGAASHVGLSQPQLSRIVARLESDLGVTLLDRASRRQSGWTPVAFKIAESYVRHARKLTQSLQQLQVGGQVTHVAIGALEGLAALATDFGQALFASAGGAGLHLIELNVYDLGELEERFVKGELDLIFTCREPGKSKRRFSRTLGYQDIARFEGKSGTQAFSLFEHSSAAARKVETAAARAVISNSLAVRRRWIETHGASGSLPSPVRKRKSASPTEAPVYLIASELTSPSFWEACSALQI